MQNKEIARRLELSLSTIEKHLTKGIRQLHATITLRYGNVSSQTSDSFEKEGNR